MTIKTFTNKLQQDYEIPQRFSFSSTVHKLQSSKGKSQKMFFRSNIARINF